MSIRTETDWRAVLAAAFCGVAAAMNVGKVPIAMSELRTAFGLSLIEAGWVASAVNTLAVFTAVAFGVAGDRLGPLRLCLAGLAVAMAGCLLGLLATTYPALLVSRIVEGAGFVSVAVSAPALLSRAASPADLRFALGIWSGYMPAGVGLVMILSPVVDGLDGWQATWALTLVMMLIAAGWLAAHRAAYALPGAGGGHAAPPSRPGATLREALGQPLPWLLSIAMGSWAIQHFALIIWLPTFLREQRALSPAAVAGLSCLMVIVNVPGNLLGGSLLQRHYRRGRLIAGASLVTGLCGLGIFLEGLPDLARYALCVLLSFAGGLIPASVMSSSATLAASPRQVGTLQGLFMQGSQFGQFLGTPAIASLVSASGRWQDALYVTLGCALLGVVMGWQVNRHER